MLKFAKFSGGACPQTPLDRCASGACGWPHHPVHTYWCTLIINNLLSGAPKSYIPYWFVGNQSQCSQLTLGKPNGKLWKNEVQLLFCLKISGKIKSIIDKESNKINEGQHCLLSRAFATQIKLNSLGVPPAKFAPKYFCLLLFVSNFIFMANPTDLSPRFDHR